MIDLLLDILALHKVEESSLVLLLFGKKGEKIRLRHRY